MNNTLFQEALNARKLSYSPYSNFAVGAAILMKDNTIITGCNVENSSYGLSNCAERTAIFKAISLGYQKNDFKTLLVVADTKKPVSPCGACRQVIAELFDPECDIIFANLHAEELTLKVKELLPYSFKGEDMDV